MTATGISNEELMPSESVSPHDNCVYAVVTAAAVVADGGSIPNTCAVQVTEHVTAGPYVSHMLAFSCSATATTRASSAGRIAAGTSLAGRERTHTAAVMAAVTLTAPTATATRVRIRIPAPTCPLPSPGERTIHTTCKGDRCPRGLRVARDAIRYCTVVLSAIFTTALNDQVTFLHPCRGVKSPPVTKKLRQIIMPEQFDVRYPALPDDNTRPPCR
jgi:hypothetical protein